MFVAILRLCFGATELPVKSLINSPTTTILAQQIWQGGAGLVTLLCIALFLTPEQQGWYYTFLSIAALATLMDFGLSAVLVHRGARLFIAAQWHNGAVVGAGSIAFHELAAWALAYYARCAALFLFLALPGGFYFLSHASLAHPEWLPLFPTLMAMTALGLLPQPFLFLIEGSGRVEAVYRLRLVQGVVGAVTGWLLLAGGFGLAATLAAPLAAIAVPLFWLLSRYRLLVWRAVCAAIRPKRLWPTLWPLQWRIGVSLLSAYLLTQLMTPILFAAQGPHVAGQMGLSLTICTMLGLMARAHFIGHVPALTQAVHRRDWQGFDRLVHRDFVWFALFFGAGGAGLFALVIAMGFTPLAGRLLPPLLFLGLLASVCANTFQTMLASQLRAFDREPLTPVTLAGAALTLAATFWAAPREGAAGIVMVMLVIQSVFIVPASVFLWRRFLRIERDA